MRISYYLLTALLFVSFEATAKAVPFSLNISGENISLTKQLELKNFTEGESEIKFDFADKAGKPYKFSMKYKKLPPNRSYPSNLDITLMNGQGDKLGYLFWANNGVAALQKIGTFGLIINVDGKPVDVQFSFADSKKGNLSIASLEDERFVQDTLVPKYGFQMIRPVKVPKIAKDTRSITYALDSHPYAVNYTIKDIDNGLVEFQYNLFKTENNQQQLLERVYYHADSMETLREGMFAGKYFDQEAGTFKLVFYPTQGQTSPDN